MAEASISAAGKGAIARGRPYWTKAHKRFERFFGDTALVALRTKLREIAEDPDLPDAFETAVERN